MFLWRLLSWRGLEMEMFSMFVNKVSGSVEKERKMVLNKYRSKI